MKQTLLHISILVLAFVLRVYKLDVVPPSISWDEASLGYNAYTIATEGTDEHGEKYPLARFEAFGDYKPPGYIYTAVPFVSVLGLSEFSVRLPSVIAGFLIVVITYFLTRELFGTDSDLVALLSVLFLTVSPWALQFARGAYESNLAAFFNLLGVYLFVKSLKKPPYIVASAISFVFSFYTFNANRIIAPLLLGTLILLHIRRGDRTIRWFISACILGFILLIPSISYLKTPESKLRFQEVSIFNNLGPVVVSNDRMAREDNRWWAKILYNRRIVFATDYLKHYFDNFSARFLFTHGDANPRLSIQEMGMLYIWELPFLLYGGYLLITRRHRALFIFIPWMLIAPIPAGTARETPHALRILSILPTYQIIAAYGVYECIRFIRNKINAKIKIFLFFVFCFLFFGNLYYYLHHYYIHYPIRWSGEWQYGYKEMVSYVLSVKDNYDHIYITEAAGRPYIYFLFYGQIPASRFVANREAQKDAFGFWEVKHWENITFGLKDADVAPGKVLVVTTNDNVSGSFRKIDEIKNLSGSTVFVVARKI